MTVYLKASLSAATFTICNFVLLTTMSYPSYTEPLPTTRKIF